MKWIFLKLKGTKYDFELVWFITYSDFQYVIFDCWCTLLMQFNLFLACLLASIQYAVTDGPFVSSNFFPCPVGLWHVFFHFLVLSLFCLTHTYTNSLFNYFDHTVFFFLSFQCGLWFFCMANFSINILCCLSFLLFLFSCCIHVCLHFSLLLFPLHPLLSFPSLPSCSFWYLSCPSHRIISKMRGIFLTVWQSWAASLTSWLQNLG